MDTDFDSDAAARAHVAEQAARVGAAVAAGQFRREIAVETKGEQTDVVTQADRDAQSRVIDCIHSAYEANAIVGEEADELKSVPEEGPTWVIDPIDGTSNFVREFQVWCTAVAAVRDGDPVASAIVAPELGDVYVADDETATRNGEPISVSARTDPEGCSVVPTMWWGRDRRDEYAAACREVVERFGDLRRVGSAQVTLAMLAAGTIDGVVTNVYANPWDTVAGVHLIRLAGGTVTDVHGDPWRHDSHGLVASNGEIHDELLAAVGEVEAVARD
ncbi:inositol monophosphatase family protein [Salinigranum halophilum]|jgi:myo-inositol-1(or 4)-monophosphatase|uniref:inositol monophosphatase family protein n=1 Tax=Salinigranum halophilum TaxID=2565931 RepID=UPI00115E5239|nr:inositol monophosphatase [Salinigranum halophilum]